MSCKNCYIEGCNHKPFPNETECVFRQWTAKQFDWQSFRAEAAKDILCAIINSPSINGFKDDNKKYIPFEKNIACKVAIEYADELIKQLKEKEEE